MCVCDKFQKKDDTKLKGGNVKKVEKVTVDVPQKQPKEVVKKL